jgi:hypothetical protein
MNPSTPFPDNPTACGACGGPLSRIAGSGRTFHARRVTYAAPEHLAILACRDCGERLLGPEKARALDDAAAQQRATPTLAPHTGD